jgi:L-fuculose-phosphate aldolase
MVDIRNIRKSICEIGKILFDRELTDSSGGNISVRDGNQVYISPRRSGHDNQWSIQEDSIIVTDLCRVPVTGSIDNVTREASTHYYIYQNFPDAGAIIHSHPLYLMVFGAAHMDLPAITEGTRAIIGEQPITSIEESVPGSREQAERIVENFKNRRKIESNAPLVCNIPFHGSFFVGANLNDAFLYNEVANNCAKILIYRQMMFGNNKDADFTVHAKFTKEDFATVNMTKEVCQPGYVYKDAFGNLTTYGNPGIKDASSDPNLVEKITQEVLNKLRNNK